MARRDPSLLAQIEQDALDDDVPLAVALRKCVALGGRSGSSKLRTWANKELRGYVREDELPPYRKISAPLKINAVAGPNIITGQQISPMSLPDFVQENVSEDVHLRQPIAELESIVKSKQESVKLTFPESASVAAFMNRKIAQPFQEITAIYWDVSVATIVGVVDQARTALVDFVAELVALMPEGAETPSAADTERALHVAVTGHRSQVTIQAPSASGGSTSTTEMGSVRHEGEQQADETGPRWWTRTRMVAAGTVALVAAIAGVGQWLGWTPW